ncbi:MAG: efflux RND transporter periplasmic adaptor subunit [Acidobacteria bacterium]|nr:MAG: efflux RND transporter periplasmic adaptor subunit [Acidobacteriota bacterium]
MRRPVALLSLLAVPLVAGCGGDPLPEIGTARAAPAGETAAPETVRVETYTVVPRPLAEEITLTGELRANEAVALKSEAAGRIVRLLFDEGQAVGAGQLLVKINDAELQAERKRTELRRRQAARREQRARALRAEETISQEVYEEALSELQVLEAELELLDARIAQTEVRSPFAGIVGLRAVSEGSYVTPATTIATLQSIDPIKVDVAAAERYAGRIRPGDRLRFTVSGLADVFQGTVYAVEPRIDAETRTLKVRARAPNPRRLLMPGAFANVRLVLGTVDDALLVPAIALVPGLDATTVFVVEDGVAQPRAVRLGVRTESLVEIAGGLEAGERVIVSGVQQVRPGTPVDAVDAAGEAGP